MLHYRLLTTGILFVLTTGLLPAQIKVNVTSPFTPDINLNEKRRDIRKQFKQQKKDSLDAIAARMEAIEQEIERLETVDPSSVRLDSAFLALDSTAFQTAAIELQLDSLYKTLGHEDYTLQQLEGELDTLSQMKDLIKWDSLQEQYIATKMQEFFQSKGYLPPVPTSQDPVGELQNSMKNNHSGMHLDPKSFKNKEALSKEAAKQLSRLKKQYLKIDDLRYPEKGVEKPRPYNTFTDRLIFGGQINITLAKKPIIDMKPNVGFMITKRIRLLMDYTTRYFMQPEISFLERDETKTQKIGTFLDVDITRGFFVRGKMDKPLTVPLNSAEDLDYFIGVGKTLTLHKNLKAQVVFSHAFKPNELGKRWFLEYGIQQQGISELFGKKGKE